MRISDWSSDVCSSDLMERARIVALGARHMDGMRGNLAASLAMRMRGDPISRAQNREDVPISSALELMLREALTGEQAPQGTETRTEEGRGGKECGSTCRSRGGAYE